MSICGVSECGILKTEWAEVDIYPSARVGELGVHTGMGGNEDWCV